VVCYTEAVLVKKLFLIEQLLRNSLKQAVGLTSSKLAENAYDKLYNYVDIIAWNS
jgi:hypothetical protein